MKILFLLDSVYSLNGATNRIFRNVCVRLAETHEVTVLENVQPGAHTDFENAKLLHYPFCYEAERQFYHIVSSGKAAGYHPARILLSLLRQPMALGAGVVSVLFSRSLVTHQFAARLRRLAKETPSAYDVVVSLSAPHYTAFALAKVRLHSKRIAYLIEPYASNALIHDPLAKRREAWLYTQVDAVLATELMVEENKTNHLATLNHKAVAIYFPNFRRLDYNPSAATLPLDHRFINLVYIGMLYPKIRRPDYLLALFTLMPDTMVLSIAGGGFEAFPKGYFDITPKTAWDRLRLYPWVSAATAVNTLLTADILVNIGNDVTNQLPSKLLDYISTGKPILNLYSVDNCPSLKLLEGYPHVLNIDTRRPLTKATAIQTIAFCQRCTGQRVPYEENLPRYRAYTLSAVCTEMERHLKNIAETYSGGGH